MKIFLVFDAKGQKDLFERLNFISKESNSDNHYFEFYDEGNADAFLFLSHGLDDIEVENIRHHELVSKYPNKCFLWCDKDHPLPILPGLYASLPSIMFKNKLHRSIFYLSLSNNMIGEMKDELQNAAPSYLATFQGTPSSSVRKKLLKLQLSSDRIVIKKAPNLWGGFIFTRGFNSTDEGVSEYARLIYASKFVICPKGNGVSSYRFFETLEAGRVPLIISDQFVPPRARQSGDFFLSLNERSIGNLESYLFLKESEFEVLSKNAADAYLNYFSDQRKVGYIGEMLEELMNQSTIKTAKDLKKYQRTAIIRHRIDFYKSRLKIWIFKTIRLKFLIR